MGRSSTPALRIEFVCAGTRAMTASTWRREYGRPTVANVEKHVAEIVESGQPGGCNERALAGVIITGARIVRQGTNEIVAAWGTAAERDRSPAPALARLFALAS